MMWEGGVGGEPAFLHGERRAGGERAPPDQLLRLGAPISASTSNRDGADRRDGLDLR